MALSVNNQVELSDELWLQVFSHLRNIKDIINVQLGCREWKRLMDDEFIWKNLYQVLFPLFPKQNFCCKFLDEAQETYKSIVCMKIKASKNVISNSQASKERIILAHILLTRLGLSSLEKATEVAKNIPQNQKNIAYSNLATAYLANDLPLEAEKALKEISMNFVRAKMALRIVLYYFKNNHLQSAFAVMKYIPENQMESNRALSLLIYLAIQTNNFTIALDALKSFKNFAISSACATILHEALLEKKKHEESNNLRALFPEICSEQMNSWTPLYYAYTNQFDKAEQLALLLPKDKKIAVLNKIILLCYMNGNQERGNRFQTLLTQVSQPIL